MTKTSVINDIAFRGLPDGTRIIEPITDVRKEESTLVVGKGNIEVFLAAELRRFLTRAMKSLPEDSADTEIVEAIDERLGGFYDLALERADSPAESERIAKHRNERRYILCQMLRSRSNNRLYA